MGWDALKQWGDDVALIERLAGGVANDVWTVRVNGHLAVARRGVRSDADLAWETELLVRLDRECLTVPVPIPTTDGRLFANGVVVMTYVEGGPPETEADWRRVAGTLRHLRRPRRPQPTQHPHDRRSGRADRLGRGARRRPRPRPGDAPQRCRSRRRGARHRRASVGRMGSRRLLGRRALSQAARRSSSGLSSSGSESRDRTYCRDLRRRFRWRVASLPPTTNAGC